MSGPQTSVDVRVEYPDMIFTFHFPPELRHNITDAHLEFLRDYMLKMAHEMSKEMFPYPMLWTSDENNRIAEDRFELRCTGTRIAA